MSSLQKLIQSNTIALSSVSRAANSRLTVPHVKHYLSQSDGYEEQRGITKGLPEDEQVLRPPQWPNWGDTRESRRK